MVRNKEAPQCAVCEFVMKEVEGMLEDETTEVGFVSLSCIMSAAHPL